MSLVVNASRTIQEGAIDYIKSNAYWIKKNLNIDDFWDNTVRIAYNEWMWDLARLIADKYYFQALLMSKERVPSRMGGSFLELDPIAVELGGKITNITSCAGLENHLIELHPSKLSGTYSLWPACYMFCVWFEGLEDPIIFYRYLSAVGSSEDWISQIIVCKRSLESFIGYVQDIENKIKPLRLNVWRQKTQRVKILEWNQLVLDDQTLLLVKKDLENFQTQKEWYRSMGLPYKRGYLFHGPAGNGKTSIIRAMMTQVRIPAFTMKKLYGDDAMDDFEEMFDEASKLGSAFIIVEDIDRTFASKSMDKDTAKNAVPMSVFLNCLDGLAETDGIVIVATANNPKVLDPAILHRPGRFDRVISFPNPDAVLRQRYFKHLMSNCVDCCLDKIVTRCEGMSFAQCREIYILAAQLANDASRQIQESDLQDACARMEKHIKQMGGKDPGFK